MTELYASRRKVAILGAGSWGTAIARILGTKGHSVTLWDRNVAITEGITLQHHNVRYLTDVRLSESIVATSRVREAILPDTDWVIVAVSSDGVRPVVAESVPYLAEGTGIISAVKGLEADTGMSMSEVIATLVGNKRIRGTVILSGPNLAQEVVRDIPTACICASVDASLARDAQTLLLSPSFRVYTHADVKGVELGGALKNVLAIGAGISDGLGFGDNTKAAMMTRGLMEMTRLGMASGALALTFLGIAGVGDLIATATSKLSRNYRVGEGLAVGKSLDHVLREIGQAAEGVPTSEAARRLAIRLGVSTPLFDTIHDVIYSGKSPLTAVDELMSRPPRDE